MNQLKLIKVIPINPETSTREKPIRARLINTLLRIGLRRIENNE